MFDSRALGVGLLGLGLTFPAGAQELTLALPFAPGRQVSCSQGPGAGFSHSTPRAAYALDFPAARSTEVLAAAPGIAHVFFDAPNSELLDPECPSATSRTFGNHVNLDHGNGRFTVYASLDTIARDIEGKRLERGDKVGTVGLSGYSCGSHLHFGLQEGAASEPVSKSVSAPMPNLVVSDGLAEQPLHVTGSDLACGTPHGSSVRYQYVELSPLTRAREQLLGDWESPSPVTNVSTLKIQLRDGELTARLGGVLIRSGFFSLRSLNLGEATTPLSDAEDGVVSFTWTVDRIAQPDWVYTAEISTPEGGPGITRGTLQVHLQTIEGPQGRIVGGAFQRAPIVNP